MKRRLTAGGIVKHFFQGLLVLAPITITLFALYWIFNTIDNLFPKELVPAAYRIKGLGFVIVILFIILMGYLSSSFIIGRIFDLFDRLLEKTPFIRYIYTSVKDLFDAVVGEKRKFDHPVLVSIYSPDVWEIGFITQTDMHLVGMPDMVAVYVPQSYAVAGKLYVVHRTRIRPLNQVSAGEAMKFAVSGGVVNMEIGEHTESPLNSQA
ncbi:DUF502 domain-containing protein [Thermoflavifilum thermophilum]|uniref:Uncharacterized membrane protein n=1 Tax=Thermoflavifilum thermophilum TaxID=1393122 RepID=A0A1I7NBF1_9BACT|nr:DUF502 domain-containing protein [Thermoflavifilum thermophilum]SFV32000.1 Uncharacterized membrane protein [Thermoflavifilum thermophilum]